MVNDHVLKGVGPGWLTGKLSDVAFLVVAPVLVASLLARTGMSARAVRAAAIGSVAAGYVALQTWPPLGDGWTQWVGGRHVADLEDLWALPALLLAPLCWRGARRIPLAAPTAALACLATSFSPLPQARRPQDGAVAWDPNAAFVVVFDDYVDADAYAWRERISITDPTGEDVPFRVAAADGFVLAICPDGGLLPNATYEWTLRQDDAAPSNRLRTPDSPFDGTWSFTTGDPAAAEPITTDGQCQRAAAAWAELDWATGSTDEPRDTGSTP